MSIWVMRGKWDGVEEEMIVQCHGWPSLECACVDEMTNGVSVISHGPILLGGYECGHLKRWVMLAGQSGPSRASIKARKAAAQRPSSTLAITESWAYVLG